VESGEVTPRTFTLRTMPARVQEAGDVWSGLLNEGYSLDRATDQLE
jgi:hypothetical protein